MHVEDHDVGRRLPRQPLERERAARRGLDCEAERIEQRAQVLAAGFVVVDD